MEQKLAEFRARRQAENAQEKVENVGPQCRPQTSAVHTETSPAKDSQQTKEEAKIITESPDSSHRTVRLNCCSNDYFKL